MPVTDKGSEMIKTEVTKDYSLDQWELHLNLDSSPKKIVKTVLDCVVSDIIAAAAHVTVDEKGRPAIWIDANSFQISIPLTSLRPLLSDDDDVETARSALITLANELQSNL